MPSDDAIIAARIGMAPKAFAKAKPTLMRGWWIAEDGRLYHDTITERVREMLDYKAKEKQRKAEYRAKMAANVPRDKRWTDKGRSHDSGVSDATGTGTGTGTSINTNTSHTSSTPQDGVCVDNSSKPQGTPAGAICKAMKAAGLPNVSPQHIELLALIDKGVTEDNFTDAARKAVAKGKDFGYALGIVKKQLADAVAIGKLPQAAAPAAADPDSRVSVEAEGVAKGIGKWDDTKEQWHVYKARVRGGPVEVPAVRQRGFVGICSAAGA